MNNNKLYNDIISFEIFSYVTVNDKSLENPDRDHL
jgi:hypothetical protein